MAENPPSESIQSDLTSNPQTNLETIEEPIQLLRDLNTIRRQGHLQ